MRQFYTKLTDDLFSFLFCVVNSPAAIISNYFFFSSSVAGGGFFPRVCGTQTRRFLHFRADRIAGHFFGKMVNFFAALVAFFLAVKCNSLRHWELYFVLRSKKMAPQAKKI